MSLPSFRPGGQGAYPGVGQGLPNRFPAQRQASTGAALQSPPFRPNQGAFPFSAASQALPPASNAPGLTPEANLDPSDFPALGAGAPGSTNAATAASGLLSSYASQASTAAPPAALNQTGNPLLNGSAAPGLPAAAQQGNATARDFSADDFPALGGFGAAGGDLMAAGAGLSNGSANGQLPNGMNLLSGAGPAGARAVGGAGQEQASAVAALQHQQQQSQHRANLLGSMNGAQSRTPSATTADASKTLSLKQGNAASASASQQPWASTPPTQHAQPPMNGAASSPLPPAANQPSSSLDQQQQGLRSPSASAQAPPPGVSLLPPSSQPQRAVGSTTSGTPTGLPPHPSGQQGAAGSALPPPPTSLAPQTPAEQVLFSPADRYGMLGLLHIIKTTDPDLSMLALGSDLTTLGLDLGATDNLYSTFITPWSDSKAASALNIEPEFHLPSCYNVQPPPAQSKIGNFSDETLFFIFYSQPRDAMQEMAAHELYKHNWRYHKELRLWLTKEAGTEPTQKTSSYERGSYIIFDPTVWERVRKEFVLEFSALESRRA